MAELSPDFPSLPGTGQESCARTCLARGKNAQTNLEKVKAQCTHHVFQVKAAIPMIFTECERCNLYTLYQKCSRKLEHNNIVLTAWPMPPDSGRVSLSLGISNLH